MNEGEFAVAPLAGARIEIISPSRMSTQAYVAPLAGARIEIAVLRNHTKTIWSPLSQGRELKFVRRAAMVVPQPSPLSQGRELK